MTERQDLSERRLSLRRPVNIPVWVERLPQLAGQPSLIKSQTRDISNRGAFLWAPPVFQVGQHVRLEMEIEPEFGQNVGLKIRCAAEIFRVEPANPPAAPSGMAVRILGFDIPQPTPPWII